MNPSNPAKFGVAFAAGIVVALASVMIYIKTSGAPAHEAAAAPLVVQQPAVQHPAAQPEALPSPAPQAAPPLAATPAPAEVHHRAPVLRTHYPRRTESPDSQGGIRVEESRITPQNSSPVMQAPPPSTVPPIRTVNEDVAQTAPQPPVSPQYNAPAPAPPPQPHTVTLQPGTNLFVRLAETISTDHNYSGDTFHATLDKPVVVDGFIIADKGSKVLGKIVAADKAGKFEGKANLQLTITEINTTDGQRVRVETGFFNKQGPSNAGSEAAKIGGGAVLGAIIGAIAGGGKGAAIGAGAGGAAGTGAVALGKTKPAVIPSETQLSFQLSSPATITEHLN
jgi:hypothetical protein